MKRFFATLLCVLLLAACNGDPELVSLRNGTFAHLPGGIEPAVLVNGTLYYWAGSGEFPKTNEDGTVSFPLPLPEGYEAVGELSGVSSEAPEEELQMQAGFSASGTVYANPEKPLVIYVNLTTDWFADSNIRFQSAELTGDLIRWDGRLFRIYRDGTVKPPERCTPVGSLLYAPDDVLPANDLECNTISMVGARLLQDPEDPDILYVFDGWYGKTSTPYWRACRPWEPGAPLSPHET